MNEYALCYGCEKPLNDNDLNAGICLVCGWRIEGNAIPLPFDNDGFDGLGLCPRCHGAETRNGSLCRVCQDEIQADRG